MNRKGSVPIVAFLVVLIVLAVSVVYYFSHFSHQPHNPEVHANINIQNRNGIDPQKAGTLIQAAIQQYSASSELYVMPESIVIPVNASSYQSYSYYGMSFSVPWRSQPVIQISQPSKLLTLLHFSNNREIVEVFASSSSISPIAGGALSSYLAGLNQGNALTSNAWKTFYGETLQSNYRFINASLDSSPDRLSLDDANLVSSTLAATGLLVTKAGILKFLAQDILPTQNISAIYKFANSSVRGFEFVGTITNKMITKNVAHFLFFDPQDQPFNLLTVGATQDEDNFILSTLKAD
jgi:hypothetical protein